MRKSLATLLCVFIVMAFYLVPVSVNAEEIDHGTIKLNEFTEGHFRADNGSIDRYSFDLLENGNITISFQHDYVDASSNFGTFWRVTLYDSVNKELMHREYVGDTSSEVESCEIGLPKGKYYLKVSRGTYFSDEKYQIKVNYIKADNWETEFNDSFNSADVLTLNNGMSGSRMSDDDVDYYSFNVTDSGDITISFQHDYVDASSNFGTFWRVTLYDSVNKELMHREYVGDTSSEVESCEIGLPKGKYYLKVSRGTYFSDEKYQIKVNYIKADNWETEFNDSFNSADVLTLNNGMSGSRMSDDDVDYYSFNVTDSGDITISFQHDYVDASSNFGTFWRVTLYDGNNNEIVHYEYDGKTTQQVKKSISANRGKYYIKISRGTYFSDEKYCITITTNSSNPYTPDPQNDKNDDMPYYSDVPTSGKWYSNAVYYATDKGYMAGTGNNKFSPDATVTRGTIAQILYAAEGKPAVSGKSQFTDVGESKWYAKAVKWAADKGLVSGYGNGKFGPEDHITREQMVAIMMQYSKMKGYDTSANADLSKFRDQSTISKWAVNAVKWGVSHKIVSGTDKGIEPKGNATRAQIAVILQAYDKNLRK